MNDQSHQSVTNKNTVYINVVIHTLLFWFMTSCSLVPPFFMKRLDYLHH